MKKLIAVILSAALLLTLAACVGDNPSGDTSDDNDKTTPRVKPTASPPGGYNAL